MDLIQIHKSFTPLKFKRFLYRWVYMLEKKIKAYHDVISTSVSVAVAVVVWVLVVTKEVIGVTLAVPLLEVSVNEGEFTSPVPLLKVSVNDVSEFARDTRRIICPSIKRDFIFCQFFRNKTFFNKIFYFIVKNIFVC